MKQPKRRECDERVKIEAEWVHLRTCQECGATLCCDNSPKRDGNKRIGFLAMVTFLGRNGHDLEATDAEVVTEMLALADGRVSEEELADWLRQHGAR